MSVQRDSNPLTLLQDVGNAVGGTLSTILGLLDETHIPKAIRHFVTIATSAWQHLPADVAHPSSWYTDAMEGVGEPFVEAFLRGGLGVNPDAAPSIGFTLHNRNPSWGTHEASSLRSDSAPGVRELKRLVGFCIAMPFAWAGIGMLLKLPLVNRFESQATKLLGEIPTEMGISWAMGMAMSSLFETAAGRQLEELVNVQLHPNRLDMMTLRTLARQHKITQNEFWAGLDLLGYPDDLKGLILKLDTQQLALTDLQSLYITGKLSESEVRSYLQGLGFSDDDITLLMHAYITHADTQASSMYRNAVRVAFERQQITPDQLTDMLVQIAEDPQIPPQLAEHGRPHYDAAPQQVRQMVDLEASALTFQMNFGRAQQTIATIKKLYESGHITHGEVIKRLESVGYSEQSSNELLQTWSLGPATGKPGLTSAKILAYEKSGVLSHEAAYGKLLALGVNAKDASFLATNPDAKAGPYTPPFSVGTIIQAYTDKTATQQEAEQALTRVGLNAAEIAEELAIAHARMVNPSGISMTPPGPFPTGTPESVIRQEEAAYRQGERFLQAIETLFKSGAIGDQETVNMLQEIGMMQSDAGLLWASWYVQVHGSPPPQGAMVGSA